MPAEEECRGSIRKSHLNSPTPPAGARVFFLRAEALPLGLSHAHRLARNSFTASFLEPEAKRRYLDELDTFFARV